MKPGPAVGQQLGPIGINIGDVISKVNESTSGFKGMKVPVVLDIDPKTKEFKVEVSSPPASELIKKELAIEKAAGDHKKETAANASIEQIIKVAKTKHPNMLARDFKSAVKSIIGSCISLGIIVESKPGRDIQQEIDKGTYDTEINEERTETSPEKAKKLKAFFDSLHKKQEAEKAAEEAAKAEAEAEKAKAAEGAEGAEGEEAPAEGAEGEEAPAEGAEDKEKTEEKPSE